MIFSAHYIICGKYDDSLEITWSECRVAKLSDRYYCRNMARRYRIWCSCSFTFRTEKPGRNIINNIVKHLTQESFNSPRLTAAETQTFLDPASWCTYQFGFYCRYADTRKIVRARTTYGYAYISSPEWSMHTLQKWLPHHSLELHIQTTFTHHSVHQFSFTGRSSFASAVRCRFGVMCYLSPARNDKHGLCVYTETFTSYCSYEFVDCTPM